MLNCYIIDQGASDLVCNVCDCEKEVDKGGGRNSEHFYFPRNGSEPNSELFYIPRNGSEQNSELFYLLRNSSEWNSEHFRFFGTDGIPTE
jgi:hypothetical protein